MACPLRVAPRRIAVRSQRARRAAVRATARCGGTSTGSSRNLVARPTAPSRSVPLTRKQLLAGAAAGALGAAGSTSSSTSSGARRRSEPQRRSPRPDEQHLLDGVSVVLDNNVEVVVPPRHHQLITAKVRGRRPPRCARRAEDVLDELGPTYEQTPAGLGVTLAGGCRTSSACAGSLACPRAARPARARKPALLPADSLPERSRGDDARGQRCRDLAAQRLARPPRTRGAALSRPGPVRRHEHPPRLRRGTGCRRRCRWPQGSRARIWFPTPRSSSSGSRRRRRTLSGRG